MLAGAGIGETLVLAVRTAPVLGTGTVCTGLIADTDADELRCGSGLGAAITGDDDTGDDDTGLEPAGSTTVGLEVTLGAADTPRLSEAAGVVRGSEEQARARLVMAASLPEPIEKLGDRRDNMSG